MEKIEELQNYIRDYFNGKLVHFYNVGVWGRLAAALKNQADDADAYRVFEQFGDRLSVNAMTAGVRSMQRGTAPTLCVEYWWHLHADPVRLQLMIVGEKVESAKVLEAEKLLLHGGINCNFVKAFINTVVFEWPDR
jgi:hypothetical protein